MKTITDNELDLLFRQTAQRRKAVEQINRQVMKTVRRDLRLKVLRKWAKLLGICFGLPVMIVLYIYLMHTYMPDLPQWGNIMYYLLPLGTLAVFFGKNMRDFSLSDM
ncbi:MAG: hypothetical protein IKX20_03515 [Paludibacteraceae bacterium]|nr:hypothetical protein [Paludibacteraceae bacterium]